MIVTQLSFANDGVSGDGEAAAQQKQVVGAA